MYIFNRHIRALTAGLLLATGTVLASGESNLLSNGSFEEYECSAMGCAFSDWSMPLSSGTINTSDKIEGEVSLEFGSSAIAATLDNVIPLSDTYYTAGSVFAITMHYKVLRMPEGKSAKLDCYWEPEAGGDADAMRSHDSEVLQGVIGEGVSAGWETITVSTTKPAKSSSLRVRVNVPKNARVLFDAFSVEEATGGNEDDAFIHISPLRLPSVSTTTGHSIQFVPLQVEQGHLSGTTRFEISGSDKEMFHLSADSLPSSESQTELVITYSPKKEGTHTAILNISNDVHTALFQSVSLTGVCTNPRIKPSIEVIPSSLPVFEAVEGKETRDSFTVISSNCEDYVYLRVDHIEGAAFTIDGSMVGKNATSQITVRFAPREAGEYESTVTVYTEGAEPIVMPLKGKCIKRDESNIEWMTGFEWDESHPLRLMNETFDQSIHNEPLVVAGWQNVAALDGRPWWGFDESQTSPKRGTEKYAKATAYQYAKESTGIWEMFLVTPALDYKNAEGKIFAFSVMGEYMPDTPNVENPTLLEIYYVDARGEKVMFQDLTESFALPYVGAENNTWRTFFFDLEPYSETIADVFHFAFRYVGPNGGSGAVTYYIDNVSWGRTDLPQINVSPTYIIDSTAVTGNEKVIGEIAVTGKNLSSGIELSIAGPNYNRFSLSSNALPSEGGKVSVSFLGEEEGVHEAYLLLSSPGAADVYIPMAVRCMTTEGAEAITVPGPAGRKELRDGQIVIIRGEREYTPLGSSIR